MKESAFQRPLNPQIIFFLAFFVFGYFFCGIGRILAALFYLFSVISEKRFILSRLLLSLPLLSFLLPVLLGIPGSTA